jgi:hypothetical protein
VFEGGVIAAKTDETTAGNLFWRDNPDLPCCCRPANLTKNQPGHRGKWNRPGIGPLC